MGVASDDLVVLFCAEAAAVEAATRFASSVCATRGSQCPLIVRWRRSTTRELEAEADSLGLAERVCFLGFVNQSQLPSIYTASDVMVLPSEYEPFAVVVNEASCCGCPVIVSDHVGSAEDLIAPVNPSFIYPCGDVAALGKLLKLILADPDALAAYGRAGRQRMETWSIRENISGTIEAVSQAVMRLRRSTRK